MGILSDIREVQPEDPSIHDGRADFRDRIADDADVDNARISDLLRP
jgi:hypothetical protein